MNQIVKSTYPKRNSTAKQPPKRNENRDKSPKRWKDCPHKKKCTKAKENRTLQVSKKFIEQRAASLSRITSETGKVLRVNRSIQSEGAFGIIKQNYAFRRFMLREKKKVFAEILLLSIAYNIHKLHAKIQQKRTRSQLFKKVLA